MIDHVSEQSTCGKGEGRIYPSAPISHWSKFAPQLLALLGCTSWSSYSRSGSPDPRELLCSEPQQPARGPFGQPSRALQDQAHWCTCTNTRRLLRHSPSRGTKPNPALARGGKLWVGGGKKDAFSHVHNDIGFQEQLLPGAQLAQHMDWHHEDR